MRITHAQATRVKQSSARYGRVRYGIGECGKLMMLAEKRYKQKWSDDPRNTRWSGGEDEKAEYPTAYLLARLLCL